jgi:hypothetical protein
MYVLYWYKSTDNDAEVPALKEYVGIGNTEAILGVLAASIFVLLYQ